MSPIEISLATTVIGLVIDGTFAKWERFDKYKGLFSWVTYAVKLAVRM